MNQVPAVSIIIPAYNAEGWIVETLNSVLGQNFNRTWELIVVNDGSVDTTSEVVNSWSHSQELGNCSFQFVDLNENRGVSYCRNKGIDLATGEWVMFVDSDDLLDGDCLNALLFDSNCLDGETEIIFSPVDLTPNPIGRAFEGCDFENRNYTGKELYSFYRPHPQLGKTVDVCLAHLYRREFLNRFELRFTVGMSFLEDGEFIARAFAVSNKAKLQWNSFYQLRVHAASTSHQQAIYNYKALEGHFKGISSLKAFSLRHYRVENDAFLQGLIIKYSLLPYQSCIGGVFFDLKKHLWVHRNMKALGHYPIDTNSGNLYLVMLARWMNVSVYYYYFRWWLRLLGISLKAKFKKN